MNDSFSQATISPFLPAALFTADEINLLESDCGLTFDRVDGMLCLFADTTFGELGATGDGEEVNLIEFLQSELRPRGRPGAEGQAACLAGLRRGTRRPRFRRVPVL